jgi:hypothetical protein
VSSAPSKDMLDTGAHVCVVFKEIHTSQMVVKVLLLVYSINKNYISRVLIEIWLHRY